MSTPSKNDKIYFSGLNGLRFFAASAVIFHHCEQYKYWDGLPNVWGVDGWLGVFVDSLGHKAVSMFFVLSGFLITYLLLAEIKKTETVDLKKFYVRRILRIWPVYYVVLIIAFFIFPFIVDIGEWNTRLENNYVVALGLYLLIFPNLLRATSVQVVGANQAWSVGVEEQFYLLWPVLVRLFHKVFVKFLVVFIVLKFAIQFGAYWGLNNIDNLIIAGVLDKIHTVWELLQIEQMAVGAFGAWYLFNRNDKILKWVYAPITQVLTIGLFLCFFFIDIHFFGVTLLEGLVFLIIIMNVSTNDKFFLKLRSKRYDLLGNISYGIYMYHTICISLIITGLSAIGLQDNVVVFNILLYSLSFGMTILLSYLSYEYFEKFFLKFKEKFMVVKSSTAKQDKGEQKPSEMVADASVKS